MMGEGSYIWGSRFFELSNHLGNVLATIQDWMTIPKASGVDYFDPMVVSAHDNYAIGMMVPGRTYSAPGGGYRYGFNGKENDNETGYQDYGFRMCDMTGRFISVDPLTGQYPVWSPYAFALNSSIAGVDLEGLEFYFAADGSYLGQSKNGGTQIRVATEYHTNPENKSQLIFTKYEEIDNVDASIASKVYATIHKREATNRFQTKVSKYYKENLISNVRSYLIDQVNIILSFRNKGDKELESYYLKEYEKNLDTFNRLFDEKDNPFLKYLKKRGK